MEPGKITITNVHGQTAPADSEKNTIKHVNSLFAPADHEKKITITILCDQIAPVDPEEKKYHNQKLTQTNNTGL